MFIAIAAAAAIQGVAVAKLDSDAFNQSIAGLPVEAQARLTSERQSRMTLERQHSQIISEMQRSNRRSSGFGMGFIWGLICGN